MNPLPRKDNENRPDAPEDVGEDRPDSRLTDTAPVDFIGGHAPAVTAERPHKKRLWWIAAVVVACVVAAVCVWVVLVYMPAHTKKSSDRTVSPAKPITDSSLMDKIQSFDDLTALNQHQFEALCHQVLAHKPDDPSVRALKKRITTTDNPEDWSNDIWLECNVYFANNKQIRADKSGANYQSYRKNAQKFRKAAESLWFAVYDTSYRAKGIGMSYRVASSGTNDEAPNLFIKYSTLTNGGYSSYSSRDAISIYEFDPGSFPEVTSQCGPEYMDFSLADWDYTTDCKQTNSTFLGSPVYKYDGLSASYYVTVGMTRISVAIQDGHNTAQDEKQALAVISSLHKANPSKMDFFAKN